MRTMMRRGIAAVMLGGLLAAGSTIVAPAPPAEAGGYLQITRVYVNAPGSDKSTNRSVNGEYVQIKNTSKITKNLTGYTLRDAKNPPYRFGTFKLRAGKTVTVYTGKGTNTSTKRYMGRSWHLWNNSGGDKATLRNSKGTV